MQSITNGSDCGSKGDFLAWNASQWEETKDRVRLFEVDVKDLCYYHGDTKLIQLYPQSQQDAINSCSKLGNGHLPRVESAEDLNSFNELALLEDVFLKVVENRLHPLRPTSYTWTLFPYLYISGSNKTSFYDIYF